MILLVCSLERDISQSWNRSETCEKPLVEKTRKTSARGDWLFASPAGVGQSCCGEQRILPAGVPVKQALTRADSGHRTALHRIEAALGAKPTICAALDERHGVAFGIDGD